MTAPAYLIDALWIPGTPYPYGSKKPVGNRYRRGPVRLVEEVDNEAWLNTVYNALQEAIRVPCTLESCRSEDGICRLGGWQLPAWAPYAGPVTVAFTFFFDKPRDPEIDSHPCGNQGDWDKLARGTGDQLKRAGVIKDDRLIWSGVVSKLWGDPGVMVTVAVDPLPDAS